MVDRYVKSIFLGLNPRDILCITLTNAAVFEMESRISDILEKLYLNEDNFTERYLKETLNLKNISGDDVTKAENLFFKFQDKLSQLKITTIHSFCQDLLQQFPLESGISPNFRILDEIEALQFVQKAKDLVLSRIPEDIVKKLSRMISIKTLEDFVNRIYQYLPKFIDFFKHNEPLENYGQKISKLFELTPFQDFSFEQEDFIKEHFANDDLDEVYLTKTGTLRKKVPFADNAISQQISEIVLKNSLRQKKLKTIDKTCAFLKLVKEIVDEYQKLKNTANTLDFSDVLYKTKSLLTESCAKEFVSAKICSGIKSIMIDEAQDLSPIQWELISLISDEIYSDPNTEKTIFMVGDIKQSIYRFQGADCNLFSEYYRKTSQVFRQTGRELRTVYLDTSYRTLPKILEIVDKVFEGEVSRTSLGSDLIHYQKHKPFRDSASGKFEIIRIEDDENQAFQIVQNIASLKTDNSLILTRSRNDLSENIMNELSKLGVEIAPPDRIKLNDNLLIMDLLAIADVCIDQNNDYAICCALKSSYIFENPLTNDDLFEVCYNRIHSVLDNLKTNFSEKHSYFNNLVSEYDPYELEKFFYSLSTKLHNLSPNDTYTLTGFMDEVAKFSKNSSESIPEFLEYFRSGNIELTNQNISKTAVRFSTIHGAKGLEADTVFLLDFDLEANKSKTKFLFSDSYFFIKPPQKDSFPEINQIAEKEYYEERRELFRLLYVAMTRPRDNLFIISSNQNNGKTATALIESKCLLSDTH